MMDFADARTKMVDSQVRPNDVTNHALINAMLTVPREEFVPSTRREFAYIDEDMALDVEGRYLMEPGAFAKLTQLADVKQSDVVLASSLEATGIPLGLFARDNDSLQTDVNRFLAEMVS